jgi:hypothetical protein
MKTPMRRRGAAFVYASSNQIHAHSIDSVMFSKRGPARVKRHAVV